MASTAASDVNADGAAPAAAAAAPAVGAVTYEKGEKVLVLQTPLLYNAKVLKVGEDATQGNLYFVHYDGWKKKWDEWVPPARMFKRNEDNLRLQKEYKARHNEKRKQQKEAKVGGVGKSGGKRKRDDKADGGSSSSSGGGVDNRKKRSKHANGMSAQEALKARRQRIDPRDETEDDSLIPMVKLNLPASLKKVLVDDWENITIAKKLLDLPRPVTVRNVLDAWIESKRAKSSSSSSKSKGKEKVAGKDDKQGDGGKDASKGAAASGAAPSQYDLGYIEIAAGLRAYFDRALGSLLLYRFEREQYDDILADCQGNAAGCRMSGVYGPVHLLRLFVKLPALLAATTLDSDAMSTLQSRLLELVKFMASRQEEYFQASAYKFAPQPYVASFNKHSRKLGVPTTASGDAPGVSQPPAQLLAASLDKDALAKERAIAAASASASSSSSSSSSADEKGASVAPTAVAAS